MRNNDRYRKGGPEDDVAQNIRNQQQADAAPSAEEAKAMHMSYLRSNGCHVDWCEISDPDELTQQRPVMHNCSAHQTPPEMEPQVVCEKHKRPIEERRRAQIVDKVETEGLPVVRYDCDIYRVADYDEPDHNEPVPPRYEPTPTIDTECRCGAEIKDVVYPE